MNALEQVERHADYGVVKQTGVNRHSENSYTIYYVGPTVVVRCRVCDNNATLYEMDIKTSRQKTQMVRGAKNFVEQYIQQRYGVESAEKICA